MADPFADPQSEFVKLTDYEGRLVLLTPTEFTKDVETTFGKADAVDANLVVLDGPDAPLELGSTRVFQKFIVNSIKGNVATGRPVLGVVGKGQAAKKGQSPPWILTPASTDQRDVARKYIESQSPFADPSAS
jgi:hypothetical protein